MQSIFSKAFSKKKISFEDAYNNWIQIKTCCFRWIANSKTLNTVDHMEQPDKYLFTANFLYLENIFF